MDPCTQPYNQGIEQPCHLELALSKDRQQFPWSTPTEVIVTYPAIFFIKQTLFLADIVVVFVQTLFDN